VFSKVLVANRGEIAVRIIRALEELGIASVAVYSAGDRDSVHVARAGEAYLLGGDEPAESYLNVARLLRVAAECGADAIHPGYGFLAESADFATRCTDSGIVFIGPPAAAIEAMGTKVHARALMAAAGVPIVPGTTKAVKTVTAARKIIDAEIGYPVAVKASGGGGGKGLRVAHSADELPDAFEGAAREGERFFGDATLYLERYLPDPRHVEVQIIADAHGNVVHLGERDCSVQRRHQKLIEESPAAPWIVDTELRQRIGRMATDAARAIDYRGAGTVEGLLVGDEYYFLEMNTRVQVEHCVTEMTTGADIVKTGIRVAAGEPIPFRQEDVVLRGHAIECRINAEDAGRRFMPTPGRIVTYREPSGPGVRVDSGVVAGSVISSSYDPMIAKLIVWDADRAAATQRMLRALSEFEITGLTTLIPFHQCLLETKQWAAGETCRDLVEDERWLATLAAEPAVTGEGVTEEVTRAYAVEVDGRRFDVRVSGPPGSSQAAAVNTRDGRQRPTRRAREGRGSATNAPGGDVLASPMQGTVLKIAVEAGARVEEGALIAIIEAMKMENEITAHKAGRIAALPISVGASVASGDALAVIES
jgi:acetyl-CoA/propionyl-CoA carboxylase, biotin carboxylase, biotin carboxyl carrier protein